MIGWSIRDNQDSFATEK